MKRALIIGGTRFIGRHLVSELLAHDYDVTIFNRGNHDDPFEDDDRVSHVQGDRKNDSALEAAASEVRPDAVFDCVAYQPRDVHTATSVFSDVEAYVYISSGGAYGEEVVPKRESSTGLHECTPEQATDDSPETYGPRKAEGDRAVFAAAERGVNAMSVRPTVVYGPYDYTERMDYWFARTAAYDRVVVPGDGDLLWHRVYVEDVASAMRIVAENGAAGEAYNVGDQRLLTFRELVEFAAAALETDVEVVPAGERELAAGGLAADDFPLYRGYPHVLDTSKLESLGWESTPKREAYERTATEHRESDRDGRENGPERAAEESVLGVLETL